MNFNQINGLFYSPGDPAGMEICVEIIIDRTSVEVFAHNGAFSCTIECKNETGNLNYYCPTESMSSPKASPANFTINQFRNG
jgi:hypothetical protein